MIEQNDRRAFLGGSDAAAVMGMSPWKTPLDLWREKMGDAVDEPDPQRQRVLNRGKRLEPVALDMLIEEEGVNVIRRSTPERPNRYSDAEFPYMRAEIDFEWADEHGVVHNGEIKTVHPRVASLKFGEEGTDEIPLEYYIQALHGQMVTGRSLTLFGVLVGADTLLRYYVKRDDEMIAELRRRLVRFWEYHVAQQVPPDPVNLEDCLHLMQRIRPQRVEVPPEILQAVDMLKRARLEGRMAKEAEDDAKLIIGQALVGEKYTAKEPADALCIFDPAAGRDVLTLKYETRATIDSGAVREQFPEVAARCTRTSGAYVFRTPDARKKRA